MNQELLNNKMRLFCAMYEHKGIWDDMEQTESDFKNVFVGHKDDVLYYTFDDKDGSFDLCDAVCTIVDEIKSSDKKIAATWAGYVGCDGKLMVVIALK